MDEENYGCCNEPCAPQQEGRIMAVSEESNPRPERLDREIDDRPHVCIREITIKPLDYGFIVKVGCQSFAMETKETVVEKLTTYLNNPSDTEVKWMRDRIL